VTPSATPENYTTLTDATCRLRMKLYSAPLSLFSRKVEIALREKAIDFEREMAPFTQAQGYEPRHPVVLAVNPKRQVPVLIDGDLALFDSTLIFEYLEDLRPSPPLYPADIRMRARCRLLELTGDEILAPLAFRLGYRTVPRASDAQVQADREAAGHQAEADIAKLYDDLSGRLGVDDFFCGGFSYADIALFMAVLFVLRLNGPRLNAWPVLARWYARVGASTVGCRGGRGNRHRRSRTLSTSRTQTGAEPSSALDGKAAVTTLPSPPAMQPCLTQSFGFDTAATGCPC
jgi:glutathione S-transferase